MYKRTWTWTCNLCAWLCPLVHVSVSSSGPMLGCLSMGLHAFLCGGCAGVLCMCAFAAMPVCVDLCAFLPFCIYLVLSLPLCAFVRGVHVYAPVCPSLSVCAYVKCVCVVHVCLHVFMSDGPCCPTPCRKPAIRQGLAKSMEGLGCHV